METDNIKELLEDSDRIVTALYWELNHDQRSRIKTVLSNFKKIRHIIWENGNGNKDNSKN